MALSKLSVQRAWNILNIIDPNTPAIIQEHTDDRKNETGIVFGWSKKEDGGYESIHLNVKSITPAQLSLFERMKTVVPNSHVINDLGNGITRIGWF